MCEEGSESKSGSEEGLNVCRTLGGEGGGADPRTNDLLTLMNCVQDFQHQ